MINFRVLSLKINSNTIDFEIVCDRPFGRPWYKVLLLCGDYYRVEVEQIKGATFIRFIWISFLVTQSRFQIFITILIYVLLGNRISFRKVSSPAFGLCVLVYL